MIPEQARGVLLSACTLFWLGVTTWLIDWWQADWHWRWVPVQATLLGSGLLLGTLVYTWAIWKRPQLIRGFTSIWAKRVYMVVMSPALVFFVTAFYAWEFFQDTATRLEMARRYPRT